MKKLFLIAVLLAVFTAVYGIAVEVQAVVNYEETFAKYVPDDAIFFTTAKNIEQLWAEITASNFWKEIGKLKIWEETDIPEGFEDFREEFAENLGFELNTANVMSIIGKELGIALFITDGDEPKIEFILLSKANPKKTVEDIVAKLAKKAAEEAEEAIEFTSVTHKGIKINSIKPKGEEPPFELRHAFIDDMFVFGVGNVKPRIEAIIDCGKGDGKSLTKNAKFQKVMAAAAQRKGTFLGASYFDLSKTIQLIKSLDTGEPEFQFFTQMLEQSLGFADVMGVTTTIERGLRTSLAILPPKEIPNELMRLSMATPPAEGTHMKFIPSGSLIYFGANNSIDMQKAWPLMLEQWEKQGVDVFIKEVIEGIEKSLDIDFEKDVISWIGNEIAFLITDVDTKGPFPYPSLSLLLKVKEKAKAQAFIEKLVNMIKEEAPEEMGLEFKSILHSGYKIDLIAIPNPMDPTGEHPIQPAYAFIDNFFVLSSTADHIKQMADTSKGKTTALNDDLLFKQVGFPSKTNGLTFINWQRLMTTAREISLWVVSLAEMRGAGDEAKEVVDNYVIPILRCLSVIKSIGIYSISSPEGMVGTYIINVQDLPVE